MTGPVPVAPVRSRWSHLCNCKSSAYGAGDCRFDPGRGYLKVPYATFLTMGTQIPVIDEKPLAACGSGKFHLDVMGDHLCTCTTHSGARKTHDWVNIQARLRDVQDPGDDDLGPPVSLLEHCALVPASVHPKHPTGGPSTIERDFQVHPARSVRGS
jgi:hypothetical protein